MKSKNLLIAAMSVSAAMLAVPSQAQRPNVDDITMPANMDDITMTLREYNRGEIAQQLALPSREDISDYMQKYGGVLEQEGISQDQKMALLEKVKAMVEAGDHEGLGAMGDELMAAMPEHSEHVQNYMDGNEDLAGILSQMREKLAEQQGDVGSREEMKDQLMERLMEQREQLQSSIDNDDMGEILSQMREKIAEQHRDAGNREDVTARREELIATISEQRERLQEELGSSDELRELLTERRGDLAELGEQRQALDELRSSLGDRDVTADLAGDLRGKIEEFKNRLEEQRNGH